MREYEFRANLPEKSSKFVENSVGYSHRIVTHIAERRFRAQDVCGANRFFLAVGLYLLHGHSGLAPEFGGFAALSVRQAYHSDFPTALCIECDRPAGAPDK